MARTRSDVADRIRDARARLVSDRSLGGPGFSAAYGTILDEALVELHAGAPGAEGTALLALGSYARGELCPGSDVDLLLVHGGNGTVAETADAVWYPLWDAGLIVGHATRTPREAAAVADGDVQVLTSMLDARHVAGDRELSTALVERVRRLAQKRQARVIDSLAAAAEERQELVIADLLEPNLKEGGGGLRDVHALEWAGWCLGPPGGLDGLVFRGYLHADDPRRLLEARHLLLTLRVALHRVTGRRSDDLALQEQDAVAAWVGRDDADEMVRELAAASRGVAWVASDAWSRLRSSRRGPLGRLARRDRPIAEGVVLRDARATLVAGASADGAAALRLAAAGAGQEVPVERGSLARIASNLEDPAWQPDWNSARLDLLRLLRCGRSAIPLIEALDQTGIWSALVPEWTHVRSLPQRNAYHRFSVDRHLLETVAECARILEESEATEEGDEAFDAGVARHLGDPDLLVLAALLHDIGKGLPGDHSEVGTELAGQLCRRIGLHSEATRRVQTVVRHHLLLADVATRRDLSEEATAARVARLVGDSVTLEVLYLLTVADSRATGPAAWGPVKAALVRELFVKALNLLERGEVVTPVAEERREELAQRIGAAAAEAYLDGMPPSYAAAFSAAEMVRHLALLDAGGVQVEWGVGLEDRPVCTVTAPDRPGMLAAVAGVLSSHGLSVQEAAVHTRADGRALEVLRLHDQFGRLAREGGHERVTGDLREALEGKLDVAARVSERATRYAGTRKRTKPPTPPEVVVDQEASDFATVVEVHADDRVGLLFQITEVLSGLDLDVHLAKVNTVGDRVVDAFYLRDASGSKLHDEKQIEQLRHTLLGRLQRS